MLEVQWLRWAKRLQAIASTGLHFGAEAFDHERYAEVAAIANDMLAELGAVPVERIQSLVPDFALGYATPKVDVRGAVFREQQVLLVRERSDGLWTLPGGYADVGLSAAENVIKEIREEAGLTVSVAKLYGVRHKAKHAFKPDVRDFYKFYFLCDAETDDEPLPGLETLDAGYFDIDALPPLSRGRVIDADLRLALRHRLQPELPAYFD